MDRNDALKLIDKYFQNNLSEVEMGSLLKWLEKPGNKEIFENEVEVNYLLNKRAFDAEKAFKKLEPYLVGTEKKSHSKWSGLFKYAAVFIGILGVGLFLWTNKASEDGLNKEANFVTIEMDDGEVKIVQQGAKGDFVNKKGEVIGVQDEDGITYSGDKSSLDISYNTLKIPRGMTFNLRLSDGTKIKLNADSKITYPTRFSANQDRRISLEGEGYFEVAEDSLRKFIVQTDKQEVRVYGTKFNVKVYPDESIGRTVLVEGSVGVFSLEGEELKLSPGEMAVTENDRNELEKVDAENHIAWVQDKLIFKSQKFDEIIKILERKFDITIENQYEDLNKQQFTASFENKSISQILTLFSISRSFEFDEKGNKIRIFEPDQK